MENNKARIRERMDELAADGKLPCAEAFVLAEELGISPAAVGECADEMEIRLVKCQLGLFGYEPEKKIVRPLEPVPDELRAAITDRLADGCLSCQEAFAVASQLKVRKMEVSGACDALDIKIIPCQLGAF
ncbi:MAG: hypothetical protein K9J79_11145 [Desulfobacteraceae bacterium]|nr:hypothetical protein [Desulfobacteraceae bacterium]